MSRNHEILQAALAERGEAKDWAGICVEWRPCGVEYDSAGTDCLCSKENIKNLCYLRSSASGETVIIGCVCVKKFMGVDVMPVLENLKLVAKGESMLSRTALNAAIEFGWLSDKEAQFMRDTLGKRKMSEKQLSWHIAIVLKIVARAKVKSVS